MNEKLTELQNTFDQSIKNLTEAFEGLKAEIIKVTEPEQVPDLQILPPYKPTPNEQRAELIEEAKVFWQNKAPIEVNGRFNCRPHFKVNHAKRTVTCELRGIETGYVRKRATTRCHPNEVFNEDIGKAISLCMAKGVAIPKKNLNAVQPDDVVVGMEVEVLLVRSMKSTGEVGKVVGIDSCGYPLFADGEYASHYKIIDDTNAVYADDTQ